MNLKSAEGPHTAKRPSSRHYGAMKAFMQHTPDTYLVPGCITGTRNKVVSKKPDVVFAYMELTPGCSTPFFQGYVFLCMCMLFYLQAFFF